MFGLIFTCSKAWYFFLQIIFLGYYLFTLPITYFAGLNIDPSAYVTGFSYWNCAATNHQPKQRQQKAKEGADSAFNFVSACSIVFVFVLMCVCVWVRVEYAVDCAAAYMCACVCVTLLPARVSVCCRLFDRASSRNCSFMFAWLKYR